MEEKLLAIADEVIALSASNEQIEVIAVHDQETDIRVYKGELESFTASESQGVGIRVVQDGRQGMAYAGSLDMEILKETEYQELSRLSSEKAESTAKTFAFSPFLYGPILIVIYQHFGLEPVVSGL